MLNHLASNETAYNEYLAFKLYPLSEGFRNVTLMSYAHPAVLCRLCDFAYEKRMRSIQHNDEPGGVWG